MLIKFFFHVNRKGIEDSGDLGGWRLSAKRSKDPRVSQKKMKIMKRCTTVTKAIDNVGPKAIVVSQSKVIQ